MPDNDLIGLFEDTDSLSATTDSQIKSDPKSQKQEGQSPPSSKKAENIENSHHQTPHHDSRGIPWVDFVPEFTHKYPKTLEGRIIEFLDTTDETLKCKELYKLAVLDQEIHDSYYRMWVLDANRLFRSAVLFKRRLSKLKLLTSDSRSTQEEENI